MRDANSVDVVSPSSNPSVSKFRSDQRRTHLAFVKTIRVRNLAVKTEKTYEQWKCRFLQFQHWPEIEVLGNRDIKADLEHLAVNRKVSAFTWKVALNALISLSRGIGTADSSYRRLYQGIPKQQSANRPVAGRDQTVAEIHERTIPIYGLADVWHRHETDGVRQTQGTGYRFRLPADHGSNGQRRQGPGGALAEKARAQTDGAS